VASGRSRSIALPDQSLALRGTGERFVSQFAGDDLLQRDIGERHSRRRLHNRAMSQAELAYALGYNIDQELLVRDGLGGFLKELSRHMSQGTNGAKRSGRELKNIRHVVGEGG